MDSWTALADPTRREIVTRLAGGAATAGAIAAAYDIARPGISRHLRVLREAGLVSVSKDAQRRVYRLNPQKLAEVDAWLSPFRRFWAGKLDALTDHLMREQ